MKKKPTVWLARNRGGNRPPYVFVVGSKLEWYDCSNRWLSWHRGVARQVELPQKQFEQLTPKSRHLKPGEGPIEINVKISRVK